MAFPCIDRHISHFVKALRSALLPHTPSGAQSGGLMTLLKPALCPFPYHFENQRSRLQSRLLLHFKGLIAWTHGCWVQNIRDPAAQNSGI